MNDEIIFVLLLAASVGTGLNGGLFFAFSTFVMRAFDRIAPASAIAAMNAINVAILNPLFFLAFFGTALITIVLGGLAALGPGGPDALLTSVGTGAYMLGTILVTMARNVPLNDVLAKVDPNTVADPASAWSEYRLPWTRWNHVRTVSSLVACAAFAAVLA